MPFLKLCGNRLIKGASLDPCWLNNTRPMQIDDLILLIHPILAVTLVFPILGVVTHRAWQTRQRRLQMADGGKSKLPPLVGTEHVTIGRWLAGAVVGISLLGMLHPTLKNLIAKQVWPQAPFQVVFIVLLYGLTIASLIFLYRARTKLWRGTFATLTGMGLVILACQDGIYRRDHEWFVSHFYYGVTAALLMVFSVAIVADIYQDRTNRWRNTHIVLNSIALVLFLGQGITGSRDLLEIPLGWQKAHLGSCDFVAQKCPKP